MKLSIRAARSIHPSILRSLVQVNGLEAHIALDRVRDSFFQKHQQ
jgi:hypothetical protein